MTHILHSVKDSIPDFVEANYTDFTKLIELYYEYLINNTDAHEIIDIHRYIQADETLSDYIQLVKNEMGIEIPIHDTIKNKSLIVYYLNMILKKRGNESAISAFFRLSFNQDVIVTYPYKLLLISSITQFNDLNTCLLKTKDVPHETNYYSLRGFSSGVHGDIEKMSSFKKGDDYYILIEFFSNKTLKIGERVDLIGKTEVICTNMGLYDCEVVDGGSSYNIGDVITFTDSALQGVYKIIKIKTDIVSGINVIVGGENYQIGDKIFSEPNKGFYAKVSGVDGLTGAITDTVIINNGDFEFAPSLYIQSEFGEYASLQAVSGGGAIEKIQTVSPALIPQSQNPKSYSNDGSGATFNLSLKPQLPYSYFVNNNHITGINNFIIDSNDIHEYSYIITSELDYKYWYKYIEKYFHRSGFVFTHINPTISKYTHTNRYTTKVL